MLIVLNNKNKQIENFKEYILSLEEISTNNEIVILPSRKNLIKFKSDKIILGTQDIVYNYLPISKYVLLNHSENKKIESSEEIAYKIKKLLSLNVVPILCVGEKFSNTVNKEEIVLKKLSEIFSLLNDVSEKIIIAYEPMWAIGNDEIANPIEINNVVTNIKQIYKNKVLYGGSVNDNNVEELLKINIDGYLLGTISIDTTKIKELLNKL